MIEQEIQVRNRGQPGPKKGRYMDDRGALSSIAKRFGGTVEDLLEFLASPEGQKAVAEFFSRQKKKQEALKASQKK